VCETPPDNPLLLLLLASCIVATHINSFYLSFFPSFFPYCIVLFFDFVGFFFNYVENIPSGGEIPSER
jgi:hypothetical protein